jgi:hypothetical protein
MEKEEGIFGSDPDKLAKLWEIGSDTNNDKIKLDENEVKSELLHDMLAGKMPLDQILAQTLPKVLSQLCEHIKPFTGDSFGLLLSDPNTDLLVLKRIKDYSKNLSKKVSSEAEHDVVAAIYYAAIAGALINYDQRITSFSYKSLLDSFSSMIEARWMTPKLVDLFQKARNYCANKLKQ